MKKLLVIALVGLCSFSLFAEGKREDRKEKHEQRFQKVCDRLKDKPEALAIIKKYHEKHKALREQMRKELEALKAKKKD